MNRRTFLSAALAGAAGGRLGTAFAPAARAERISCYEICRLAHAGRAVMGLAAVVAPRLPDSWALVETPAGGLWGPPWESMVLPPLLELREYPDATPAFFSRLLRALSGAGTAPWLSGRHRLLIPIESLRQRERLWRELGADLNAGAYRFAIYRPVPVLRAA